MSQSFDIPMTLRPLRCLPPGVASVVGYFAQTGRQELSPRLQSLAARQLLLSLLQERFGMESLPEIVADGNGKPRFRDRPDIHFNLSHCSDAVMAVVATAPVGCDIEAPVPEVTPELIALCLSDEEKRLYKIEDLEYLGNLEVIGNLNKNEIFSRLWTRKEAVVKRDGRIPDDPRCWPSEDSRLLTRRLPRHYISIAW